MALVLLAGCAEIGYNLGGQEKGSGRAVFTITDAAAEMGSVSSVKVTVDKVSVHSAAKGWVAVSSTPKTYDLMQLKAESKNELLADAKLEAGTYEQVRLDVSKVVVTDASGEHEAKLPSGELRIVGNLEVKANATSTATFDFIADESLHVTGNGKFIMAPVVKLETRENADVELQSGNKVVIKGGNVKTDVKVGMGLDGKVGVGIKIPADAELDLDSLGVLKIKGKTGIGVGIN